MSTEPVVPGEGLRELRMYLDCIREIIEGVDHRAMAADGPVTPTLKEMTQAEMSEIYESAVNGANRANELLKLARPALPAPPSNYDESAVARAALAGIELERRAPLPAPEPPPCLRCGHSANHTTVHGCDFQTGPASSEGTAPCCGCDRYEPRLVGAALPAEHAPPRTDPWKVVSPSEYAGADNPYAKDWIVRSDSRPGHSAIVGNEAEAIAVRDALNAVAGRAAQEGQNPQTIRCDSCGYETTVDGKHNPQSDLMIRSVGGTHVCDRFQYGYFRLVREEGQKP